jgi:hypothetical protein
MSGFATLISVVQNIMIQMFFPLDQMRSAIYNAEAPNVIPPFFKFIFNNVQTFFALLLVVSNITLISSIGLLKRKNWSRLIFIGILGLGIVWNIGSLVLQFKIVSSFPVISEDAPEEFGRHFSAMLAVMKVFSVVMAVGVSALFGWIIKRLSSYPVRREFGAVW